MNPDSLEDTLQNHREANRKRRAVDGVPIEEIKSASGREEVQRLLRSIGQPKVYPATRHVALSQSRTAGSDKQYAGESRGLTWEWRDSTALPVGLRLPWMRELEKEPTIQHNVPATQRLNDELRMCERYFSPSSAELRAARRAFYEIRSVISEATDHRDIKFELIGSRATSLDAPLSDLDINLKIAGWQVANDEKRLAVLQKLARNLKFPKLASVGTDDISFRMFLRKSAVPIIECVHIPSTLMFQVQFSQTGYESLELTKAFVAEYPTLRSLYLVLRQMLAMRGLNIGRHGGITSYPLLNMIVASLKVGSASKDHSALGAQFLEFLDFFSEIDFAAKAIRYYPPSTHGDDLGLDLEPSRTVSNQYSIDPVTAQPILRNIRSGPKIGERLMSLQDPADSTNDLGRAAYLIKHVQETFIEARQQIRQAMKSWDEEYHHRSVMRIHGKPILAWCLQGDYSQLEASRRTLVKYGASFNPE